MQDYEMETGVTLSSRTAIEATTRGEIDIQISTAKAYPRSISASLRTAEELACMDEETAGTMFYKLPRGGKQIEGPSVRMAEVIAYSWGNLRARATIIAVDETFVTARGECLDLERNVAGQHEVRRRITDKAGARFNEDMINVTCNAACSIAYREAVFKIVPRSIFRGVYERAKLASIGKAMSMQERRTRAMEWFGKAGASSDRVLQSLGRKGPEDLTVDDLITLQGLKTSMKEEGVSVEAAFPVEGESEPSQRAASAQGRVREAAARRRNAKQKEGESGPAPTESPNADLDAAGLFDEAVKAENAPEANAATKSEPDPEQNSTAKESDDLAEPRRAYEENLAASGANAEKVHQDALGRKSGPRNRGEYLRVNELLAAIIEQQEDDTSMFDSESDASNQELF